jgi:dCTP deaminase
MYSGKRILEEIEKKNIVIEPFDEKMLNPNSYDLHLSEDIQLYERNTLDPKDANPTRRTKISKTGTRLLPGAIYIGSTIEHTESRGCVPVLEGKSSIARLGISVSSLGGFGDNGYRGNWTLIITVVQPVIVYPGMKICQIAYHPIEGEVVEYSGKYQNSKGARPSESHKDFQS